MNLIRPLFLVAAVALGACGGSPSTPEPAAETVDPYARWNEGVELWNDLPQAARDAWHAKGDGTNGFELWAAENGYPTEMS